LDTKILAELEEEGQLIRIKKSVSITNEIAAYMRASFDVAGPAFLFENVSNFEIPVLGALYGNRYRIMKLFGVKTPLEAAKLFEYAISRPTPGVTVKRGECQQVFSSRRFIELPICKYSEKDDGFYITGGVQTAIDERHNININGVFRMKYIPGGEEDRLTINANPDRKVGRAISRANERNESLDIAVPIGVDPCVMFASQAKVPENVDKYDIAGTLQSKPIELVRCKTINAYVPTNSEIVIECQTIPNVKATDVPFGDFTGNYSLHGKVPLLKVKAVTMKKKPFYQAVMTGMTPTEDHLIGWIPAIASYKRLLESLGVEVVGLDVKGDYVSECHVSINKRLEGEPLNAILAILATHVKYCFVHNNDINVYDDNETKWSFLTRCQPERDVIVLPTMVGGNLDPSGKRHRETSKMGFDCTVPFGQDPLKYEKVKVLGVDKVSW